MSNRTTRTGCGDLTRPVCRLLPEPERLRRMPWFSALDLAADIRHRRVSCVEVMRAYLDRIEALNPRVNAVVALREPEVLLREAAARDEQLARGGHLGWLHGFPFAVKDLAAADGLLWTEGSPLYARRVADVDDPFVRRIRNAVYHAQIGLLHLLRQK